MRGKRHRKKTLEEKQREKIIANSYYVDAQCEHISVYMKYKIYESQKQ